MPDIEFDHIISLGGHCQTAYQIRRFFSIEQAHMMDWWVTPSFGLVKLLEEKFSNIFNEKNMIVVSEPTGPAVMCSYYGTMHYHDFDNAKVGGEMYPLLVRAACANNVAKFAYLFNRLINLSGKVLFIRHEYGRVLNYQHNADFDDDLILRMIAALERLLPNVQFEILLINGYYKGQADARIMTDQVEPYDQANTWHGSNQGWDEMFARRGFKLRSA